MTVLRTAAIAASIAIALGCAAPIAGADPAAPPAPAPPAPAPSAPAPPVSLKQYTNPVFHWTITVPDFYTIDASDPEWTKFRAYEPPREVGVHAMTGLRFGSLDDFVNQELDVYRQYFDTKGMTIQVVSRGPVILPNGVPAVEVVKDMVPGGRSHDLFVLVGDRGFLLSAETYAQLWDQVSAEYAQILHSFTVDQPR